MENIEKGNINIKMNKKFSDKTAERVYNAFMLIFPSAIMYLLGHIFGYRSMLFTVPYLLVFTSVTIIRNKKRNKLNKNLICVLVISIVILLFNLLGMHKHQINSDRLDQQFKQYIEKSIEQENEQD
ncbi:hypothetical protein [Lactococcus sp.]|uniref:hypothetical protein n=1 Tax=Lactococcus sp. TaxID=44273 RepID=UPI0035B38D0E